MSNESVQTQSGRTGSGPSTGSSGWFRTLMELYRVNEPYIQEVVEASRRILQTVLEGLVPGGRLKHAPIRTFFRILSGMIFILKVSSAVASEEARSLILTPSRRHSHSAPAKTTCGYLWICRTGR